MKLIAQLIFTLIFSLPLFCEAKAKEVIILLGPPGSGKGTQAETLKNETSLLHISTGDLIRNTLKQTPNSPLSLEMKSYMDKGELVPDQLIINLLQKRLEEPDAQKGFILDGFPRSVPQAEALNKIFDTNYKVLVINFDVPDEKIMERLGGRLTCSNCGSIYNLNSNAPKSKDQCDKCEGDLIQRKDDNPETIKNRLEVYKKETQPLIQYYQSKGLLKTINADKQSQEIEKEVRKTYQETFNDASNTSVSPP